MGRRVGSALLGSAMVFLVTSCKDATGPVVPVPTTVVPSAATVSFTALGQSQTLSVTVLDQNGGRLPTAPLTWSSSAENVATVSVGLVTATGNGAATLTVRSGTASAQIDVTVAQAPASVSLSASSASFTSLGDTSRVVATVLDGGGTAFLGAPVTWSVLDTLVAMVEAGLVTAVGNGTTQLVASSGAAVATASVTVAQAPSAVTLSADSLSLGSLGDTVSLSASVSDAGGSPLVAPLLTWASSDTLVATVSAEGVVTAVANGSAVVTATSGAAVDQAELIVRQIAASLTLLPDSLVLKDPGDTAQLFLSAVDAGGSPIASPSIAWAATDTAVARVDSAGVVTAVETGTAFVSAEVDGVVAQRSVRVEPEVTLVATGPIAPSGQVATEIPLAVRVEDLLGAGYGGAAVSWAAGAGSITSATTVTSDASGDASAVWLLDTGAGAQSATASIESRGNVIEVTFTATALAGPATSAALAADSILLSGIAENALLIPTYADQYGNPTVGPGVVWVSRAPGVATVSAGGLVTATSGPGSTWVVGSLGGSVDSLLVTVALRGAITVTFDDGFLDAYTNAWPVFQEFGMIGNIAVNPAAVDGGWVDYMTKPQLDELHAAGFSIVSHSMTHDSLTTTTLGELDYEIRVSQEWIDAQGYEGGNVFVVPYHDWGTRERDAIAVHYEAARGISANSTVPDTLVSWMPPDPYGLTGIDTDQLPFTTPTGRNHLRQMLQRAVDEGRFLDVFFHRLAPADVDAFRQTLSIIDEFADRVLPYRQLYPRTPRTVF